MLSLICGAERGVQPRPGLHRNDISCCHGIFRGRGIEVLLGPLVYITLSYRVNGPSICPPWSHPRSDPGHAIFNHIVSRVTCHVMVRSIAAAYSPSDGDWRVPGSVVLSAGLAGWCLWQGARLLGLSHLLVLGISCTRLWRPPRKTAYTCGSRETQSRLRGHSGHSGHMSFGSALPLALHEAVHVMRLT